MQGGLLSIPWGTTSPQHPQRVPDPSGRCRTASPKGQMSWGMNIFNFQKTERPHSLSDLAGDNLLFQKNIQALQKPPSCWPPGHLKLPEM